MIKTRDYQAHAAFFLVMNSPASQVSLAPAAIGYGATCFTDFSRGGVYDLKYRYKAKRLDDAMQYSPWTSRSKTLPASSMM